MDRELLKEFGTPWRSRRLRTRSGRSASSRPLIEGADGEVDHTRWRRLAPTRRVKRRRRVTTILNGRFRNRKAVREVLVYGVQSRGARFL